MHTPSCCTWDARHYHRSWVSRRETKEPQQLDSRGLRGLASRCRWGFTVLQPVPGSTQSVNIAIHLCSTCVDAISYSFWDWDWDFLSSETQWSSLTHRCHKYSMFKVWFLEIHALAHTFIKAEASKQTKTWTFAHFWGWTQQSNYHACSCRPKGVTYRNHPAADIFIQTDFSPNQNINTAVPEGLGLRRRTWYSNLSCDKDM